MSTLRLRYVQAWVDRDGRAHHYFRRPGYPRIRLPGLPGSAEFNRAYQTALDAVPAPIGAKRTRPGSLSAAIVAYYESLQFRSLRGGTPAARRAILERFRADHGDKPIALLPPKFIVHMLSSLKPHAARNWRKAIRHLMQFCVTQELVKQDPTQGVRLPSTKSDGHHTWTEEEIAQFEAYYPIGSKARLALALGLYTAQRRGDVIRMGRQHIRDGVLTVRQKKTGAALAIPVHPHLRAILDATPGEHLTFLISRSDRAYAANDFSVQFGRWCDAAGLPQHCVFHGLRKAALTRLAEAGCTVHEIAAISGHVSLKEIQRYTNAVDQARLAREAMARTIRNSECQRKPDEVSKPLMELGKK